MAKNDPVGDNARRGAVRDRSQVFNPTRPGPSATPATVASWTKRRTASPSRASARSTSSQHAARETGQRSTFIRPAGLTLRGVEYGTC